MTSSLHDVPRMIVCLVEGYERNSSLDGKFRHPGETVHAGRGGDVRGPRRGRCVLDGVVLDRDVVDPPCSAWALLP